jgi:hypothetical protein
MAWIPSEAGSWGTVVYYRVLFGHEHANFSIQTTASINASSGRTSERSGK